MIVIDGDIQQISLGQGGSVYESGTTAITPPSGKNMISITAVGGDAVFGKLEPSLKNGTMIGNTTTSSDYNGDAFTTLTEGVTIYGSWEGITLSSGAIIAYFG